jgi:hypothetical protein
MKCTFNFMWDLRIILLLADLNVWKDVEFITSYVTQEIYWTDTEHNVI